MKGSTVMTFPGNGKPSLGIRAPMLVLLALLVLGISRSSEVPGSSHQAAPDRLIGVPSAADEAAESQDLIAFLEERLRRDPGDADVYSSLAGLYLTRLRDTGALEDLDLAARAAHQSLSIVPAVRNAAGLMSLAQAEFAAHEFTPARDAARQLTHLDGSGAPYALLGDALAELGDYAGAQQAYKEMQKLSGAGDENVATRLGRSAQLRGDVEGASSGFRNALARELQRRKPSRERIAWFEWQLGDMAFYRGDDKAAEANYDAALTAYPNYFRARASLGRLRAAAGDLPAAIAEYETAVRILPDPTFIAELGDLYKLCGRLKDARTQYDLVEFIGHVGKLNGILYNRQIAMFYADHDLKAREAFRDADLEYRVRRDILGADTLAWTALKAGKLPRAQAAIKSALRLGTQDPRLFYHAGMIARAAGDPATSRMYLQRALALNPHFDPLQATIARSALTELQDERKPPYPAFLQR